MLSKSGLRDRIVAELDDLGFSSEWAGRDEEHWIIKLATAIGNAVVDEIQANAKAVGNDSDGDSHELAIE